MLAHNRALIGILVLAASVWIGSLVCLVVVASAARSSLDAPTRVAFFRALGRRYGMVGGGALATVIGVGLAMGWPPSSWDRLEDTAAALTAAVVVATAAGVGQARGMTRLRQRSLERPTDPSLAERVRLGARVATVLRGLIAALSLAVVAVTACVIGS
jgi:uncharacterized membrane protein